ncbi:conserved membrane hypothetical protein [uncultured Eubacteriales bacterium]|uniref:Acid-resistance membrane protein n=1 Tax=uncultured Eubacteriales bacterium TaxID=172733 RepID=A0A212K1K1_9FIRM|nr:conserved membrane hypothetical protein [uncultured Eubacteriales bacterium]
MKEFFRNMKVNYLVSSLLYIAFGMVILLWPAATGSVLCFAFGGILLLYGAISILSFFVHSSRLGSYRLELVLGVVAAAVGVLFLLNPEFVLSIFPVILGLYIIIDALLNLKRAIELRRMEYPRWWIALLLTLIAMGLGVLILMRPLFLSDFLFMVIGGVLIYNGLADLWAILMLGRVGKEFRKNHPIEVDPIDIE